jgi:hypothetical protein
VASTAHTFIVIHVAHSRNPDCIGFPLQSRDTRAEAIRASLTTILRGPAASAACSDSCSLGGSALCTQRRYGVYQLRLRLARYEACPALTQLHLRKQKPWSSSRFTRGLSGSHVLDLCSGRNLVRKVTSLTMGRLGSGSSSDGDRGDAERCWVRPAAEYRGGPTHLSAMHECAPSLLVHVWPASDHDYRSGGRRSKRNAFRRVCCSTRAHAPAPRRP